MSEATQVAVASEVKAPKAKKASKSKAPKGGLEQGSTRLRLFKALARFTNGLSANQIKEKTGMLPGSGHLAVLLGEEQEAKRITSKVHEPQEGEEGRACNIYTLTAAGRKAVADGTVDKRGGGEGRVGVSWTKARRKASA